MPVVPKIYHDNLIFELDYTLITMLFFLSIAGLSSQAAEVGRSAAGARALTRPTSTMTCDSAPTVPISGSDVQVIAHLARALQTLNLSVHVIATQASSPCLIARAKTRVRRGSSGFPFRTAGLVHVVVDDTDYIFFLLALPLRGSLVV